MGLFNLLGVPFAWILSMLYKLIGNYGITLIVFTVLTSAAMLPLFASQMKNTGKMAALQPKMAEIQSRYADDKETQNRKLQELYAKENYKPTAGCAPMVIQLIIVFALFAVLRNPLSFKAVANEAFMMATHEKFGWMNDLSQPDPWVMPILAAITQFMVTKATNSAQPGNGQNTMNKMMLYFFPLMLLWLGRSMPAGLCMYWVVRSLISFVQTVVLNKKRAHEMLRAEVEKEFR